MTNPNTSGIPGMGAMTDTFDFMKNLWGGMSMPGLPGMKIPGMVMPTLSVEEIDKQIKDLKSVESWLTMNLTMLRGTIQALEVQSATITTIQSVSASFASAMKPNAKPDADVKEKKPGKPIFESPFTSAAASKPEAEPAKAASSNAEAETTPKAAAEDAAAAHGGDAPPLIPPMANPAAWWGMLQDQFKQAVDTAAAMTPEMPAAKPATAAKPEEVKPKTAKTGKAAPAKGSTKRKA
ncbi:MAG: PhaM family polyhydroxyalkanoate granule multifunctional regulatory protein [Burkholderiaceae bacterium]